LTTQSLTCILIGCDNDPDSEKDLDKDIGSEQRRCRNIRTNTFALGRMPRDLLLQFQEPLDADAHRALLADSENSLGLTQERGSSRGSNAAG
jgi:hypothetical protein